MLARNGDERPTPKRGAEVFLEGLRRIEDAAIRIGGIEVINVCLHKPNVMTYEQISLDRLLNRINSSVKSAGCHAFLIFDEGKERMITRAYRRLRIFNPPSPVGTSCGRRASGPRTYPWRTSSEAPLSEAPTATLVRVKTQDCVPTRSGSSTRYRRGDSQ